MRRRRLLVVVCVCSAIVTLVGAGLGFVVRGAHAGPRPGSPNIASSPVNPECYRWAVSAGPDQGTGNNSLAAVATVPNSNQVWAVGEYVDAASNHWQTLIERFDGTRWSIVPSPNVPSADNYLTSVTATSPTNVWAVGYTDQSSTSSVLTLIEHWNGTSWSIVSSPSPNSIASVLYAVTALSATNVWAVGFYFDTTRNLNSTLIEHWNGSNWIVVSSPNGSAAGPKSALPGQNSLYGVTALSANDIWAVGTDSNTTLAGHWNGTSWSIVPTPNGSFGTGNLQSVAALSSTNVMAVGFTNSGENATLAEQWNGSSWSIVPSPNPTTTNNNVLYSISAVPGTQSYIAAGTATAQGGIATRGVTKSSSHGGPYSSIPTSKTLVESWNGASWSLLSTPNLNSYTNGLSGIAAASATTIWAVGVYQASASGSSLIMRFTSNGMEIACTR